MTRRSSATPASGGVAGADSSSDTEAVSPARPLASSAAGTASDASAAASRPDAAAAAPATPDDAELVAVWACPFLPDACTAASLAVERPAGAAAAAGGGVAAEAAGALCCVVAVTVAAPACVDAAGVGSAAGAAFARAGRKPSGST
jgi:hypothetical protein